MIGLAQSVAFTDGDGRRVSLSMNVDATRPAVMVMFFLLVSFIIARNFVATRERVGSLASFLVFYGLAMSVFALIQHFAWDGRFYWLRPTDQGTVFGPFVNRNHYAGYIEMLAPIPVALIITRGVSRESWALYGFAAAIMGISVIVTLSRGGTISLISGMVFLAIASARLNKRNEGKTVTDAKAPAKRHFSSFKRVGVVAFISIAVLAGVIWIGAEAVLNRAVETLNTVRKSETQILSRTGIWKDTWAMIRANPVMGVGIGAYEAVYPMYGRGDGTMIVDYAHNDYLQVLSDTGIIGGFVALCFLGLIFRAIRRGAENNDPLLRGAALGGGASIFSILVHSLFDFNLQIPSNALLFLVLAAVVSSVGALEGASELTKAGQPAVAIDTTGLHTGVRS